MKITVVCPNPKCHNHDNDPVLEINFRDGSIVYLCPECNQESRIGLKPESQPYPRSRRLR